MTTYECESCGKEIEEPFEKQTFENREKETQQTAAWCEECVTENISE